MRIRFALIALLSLFASSTAVAELPLTDKDLSGTTWEAIAWGGAVPKPQFVPRLSFAAESRLTARAGCNIYSYRFSLAGERITFTSEGSTKMNCQGERGETDARMAADLKRIARLALQADGSLIAHAADGAAILHLRRIGPEKR